MPTIHIQETELPYEEADIVTFDEGLIGLPQLRRMVLVRQHDIEPFMWLASPDDPQSTFLVVEPRSLFPDYAASMPAEAASRLGAGAGESPLVLVIVRIASEWTKSAVNLRAPLFIAASRMRGAQAVLTDSAYRLDEQLPLADAA